MKKQFTKLSILAIITAIIVAIGAIVAILNIKEITHIYYVNYCMYGFPVPLILSIVDLVRNKNQKKWLSITALSLSIATGVFVIALTVTTVVYERVAKEYNEQIDKYNAEIKKYNEQESSSSESEEIEQSSIHDATTGIADDITQIYGEDDGSTKVTCTYDAGTFVVEIAYKEDLSEYEDSVDLANDELADYDVDSLLNNTQLTMDAANYIVSDLAPEYGYDHADSTVYFSVYDPNSNQYSSPNEIFECNSIDDDMFSVYGGNDYDISTNGVNDCINDCVNQRKEFENL